MSSERIPAATMASPERRTSSLVSVTIGGAERRRMHEPRLIVS